MRGHTLERLQTRTMQTGDLDSSFDDRSRDVATGEPQLGPPQIRGVSPMESTAELPVQAILDSSDSKWDPSMVRKVLGSAMKSFQRRNRSVWVLWASWRAPPAVVML